MHIFKFPFIQKERKRKQKKYGRDTYVKKELKGELPYVTVPLFTLMFIIRTTAAAVYCSLAKYIAT